MRSLPCAGDPDQVGVEDQLAPVAVAEHREDPLQLVRSTTTRCACRNRPPRSPGPRSCDRRTRRRRRRFRRRDPRRSSRPGPSARGGWSAGTAARACRASAAWRTGPPSRARRCTRPGPPDPAGGSAPSSLLRSLAATLSAQEPTSNPIWYRSGSAHRRAVRADVPGSRVERGRPAGPSANQRGDHQSHTLTPPEHRDVVGDAAAAQNLLRQQEIAHVEAQRDVAG